jgi:hypothetical protein
MNRSRDIPRRRDPAARVRSLRTDRSSAANDSPAGAGRLDVWIVHDRHPDLIQGARMIHGFGERDHDALKALGLLHIERARRGLGPALLARLGRGRTPSPAQPPVRMKRTRAAMSYVRMVMLFRSPVPGESHPPLLEERH